MGARKTQPVAFHGQPSQLSRFGVDDDAATLATEATTSTSITSHYHYHYPHLQRRHQHQAQHNRIVSAHLHKHRKLGFQTRSGKAQRNCKDLQSLACSFSGGRSYMGNARGPIDCPGLVVLTTAASGQFLLLFRVSSCEFYRCHYILQCGNFGHAQNKTGTASRVALMVVAAAAAAAAKDTRTVSNRRCRANSTKNSVSFSRCSPLFR